MTIRQEIYDTPLHSLFLIRTVICLSETSEHPYQQFLEGNSFTSFSGDVLAVNDSVLLKGVNDDSYPCLPDYDSGDFPLRRDS